MFWKMKEKVQACVQDVPSETLQAITSQTIPKNVSSTTYCCSKTFYGGRKCRAGGRVSKFSKLTFIFLDLCAFSFESENNENLGRLWE